jgi:protein-disulfide isomerase
MATRAEERERLRQRRLEREERAQQGERRLLLFGGGAAVLAICVVAALIAISQSGGGDGGEVAGAAEVAAHLEGIPQRGAFLGDPDAEVTVVEFGDLQCPVCKEYSSGIVAALIDGPVRQGRAKLEFRNWAILGPQSRDAAAAAYAAGEQDRQWSFTELFYRSQGVENSGYVTDEFLRSIAEGAGVRDLARWERDRASARWDRVLARTGDQSMSLGFTGTPSFLIVGPKGTQALGTPHSAGHIEAAIAQAG